MIATHGANSISEVNPRLGLIAFLVTIWGVRLTFNFWRKGGYQWNAEDYRWPVLKERMHPVVFQIFNFIFVAIIQNVLLSSLLLPAYVAWKVKTFSPHLNALDGLAFVVAASFLFLEAIADNQQWKFQTAKHAALRSRKRLSGIFAKGFLDSGIWKYSRHPNFFAEQSFWWSLCLFASAATGHAFGAWMSGAFALSLLFQGSTALTEGITASKYPAYVSYQQTTSKFVPWFKRQSDVHTITSPTRPRRASTGAGAAVVEAVVEEFKTPVALQTEEEKKEEQQVKDGAVEKAGSSRRSGSRSRSRSRTQASSGKKTETKTAKARSLRSSSTGPAKNKRESSTTATGDGKTEKTTTSSRARSSSRPRRSKSASRSSDAPPPRTITTRRTARSRAA